MPLFYVVSWSRWTWRVFCIQQCERGALTCAASEDWFGARRPGQFTGTLVCFLSCIYSVTSHSVSLCFIVFSACSIGSVIIGPHIIFAWIKPLGFMHGYLLNYASLIGHINNYAPWWRGETSRFTVTITQMWVCFRPFMSVPDFVYAIFMSPLPPRAGEGGGDINIT